jgi:hypothetical protein
MPAPKFDIGTIVRLRGQSTILTVTHIFNPAPYKFNEVGYTCEWIDKEEKPHSKMYLEVLLEPVITK